MYMYKDAYESDERLETLVDSCVRLLDSMTMRWSGVQQVPCITFTPGIQNFACVSTKEGKNKICQMHFVCQLSPQNCAAQEVLSGPRSSFLPPIMIMRFGQVPAAFPDPVISVSYFWPTEEGEKIHV